MSSKEKRQSIIDACLELNATGLNHGTSGNISLREGNGVLITPSAIPYAEMRPEMLPLISFENDQFEGDYVPSTEWRFHRDLMRARSDFNAIVHTHSNFATIVSCMRQDIPAIHYMIAAFGGNSIRCANYARYGTQELSDNILEAIKDRSGCIMANHGLIVGAASLKKALWLVQELETLAQQYYHTQLLGGGFILDDDQINEVLVGFKTYGLKDEDKSDA